MREQLRAQVYPASNGVDAPPAWAATLDHDRPPPESAPTEPAAPRFGAQGEVVVAGSTSLDLSRETFSSPSTQLSSSFEVGVDYFVLPNLSVGLSGGGSSFHQNVNDGSGSAFTSSQVTVAARLGYNVPLGDYVSWYPRLAFGVASTHYSDQFSQATGAETSESGTASGPWMDAFAPILFHPMPHFFFGVGPGIQHTFANQNLVSSQIGEPTEVYGEVVFGVWWGGAPPPEDRDSNPLPRPPSHERRFGEASEWVFTGETSITASATHYSGAGSSSSVMVSPGFDYFVVNDISVGANAYGAYVKTNDVFESFSTTSYGLAAHVAVNVPLGPTFSLYPRGYLGFGGETDVQSSPGSTASESQSRSGGWVALYAPILVHPTSHVFVGLGPNVRHDLSSDSYSLTAPSNPGTTLSADLMVGGWL